MKLYEKINADNWTKGVLADHEGRRCIIGHIGYRPMEEIDMVCLQLGQAIHAVYPERYPTFTASPTMIAFMFNDHEDTTVEDVLRVCKLADV